MKWVHAEYNPMHNSIYINHYNGYILRIDCNQAESVIRTTPNSQSCLNAMAIDNSLEYAILALNEEMQAWMDAEDSLDIF
ncbi:MAG TPA: toxin-antitoxin system protein [Eubacterium sp.]|nr:toxin-antitoxin system protein [Eubacterium sp.]HCO34629.1 toxin-antitoxin system protein [Eubacterium sp.]